MREKKHGFERSPCPIASSLDIVGDKWTPVVMRDLLCGKKRYGDFLESPEGIPTNILAERLKRLQSNGMITKERYQSNPPRYEYRLTRKGKDFIPVLQELSRWGNKHIPGTWVPPAEFMERSVEL